MKVKKVTSTHIYTRTHTGGSFPVFRGKRQTGGFFLSGLLRRTIPALGRAFMRSSVPKIGKQIGKRIAKEVAPAIVASAIQKGADVITKRKSPKSALKEIAHENRDKILRQSGNIFREEIGKKKGGDIFYV